MVDVFLGKYSRLSFLGHGSMAQVWLAHLIGHPDQLVVVKVMLPTVVAQPRFRQFFDREVQSLAKLRHPYIVRLIDSSYDDPVGPCLVMEYVPGVTLETLLKKQGPLPVGHVGLLLGYLCHALESAHTMGIVHRDLKPANLMVVDAGSLEESIRVMDFGLAEFAGKPHFTAERLAGAASVTAEGTPCYISPESLRGDQVDSRADLYSVGVVLFEMLTGHMPFPHVDVDRLLKAHLYETPQRFWSVGASDVPRAVEAVVQLCLSKYAVERPRSARKVAEQFSEAIGLDIWEAARAEGVPDPAEAAAARKPFDANDRKAIVYQADAWMPERIAVVKLRGFLEDLGGKVAQSEPGLLRIRLGEPEKSDGRRRKIDAKPVPQPVEIELRMEKPDPCNNRLAITVLFRPFTDPVLLQQPVWRNRCEVLYKDLQSYLMAR